MRTPLLLTAALFVATAAPALSNAAGDAEFDAFGKYEFVQPPQPTTEPGKVEIVELFWYGCPHCFTFLPHMEKWEQTKPDYVIYRRIPAVFRESWTAHAHAYYTAQLLGVVEKIHRPLFEALHRRKRELDTKEDLMRFFAEHGVNAEDFSRTYDSFSVQSLVRRSMVMQERYGIRGTPSVVVNGKFRTSGSIAGSHANVIRVIDALIEQEHADTASPG